MNFVPLKRFRRNLRLVLARLLLAEPSVPLEALFLTIFFGILLSIVSNLVDNVLQLSTAQLFLLTVAIVVVPAIWLSWREVRLAKVAPPKLQGQPPHYPGLILLLSTFYSPGNKDATSLAQKPWDNDALQEALNDPTIGWPVIIERFAKSNMEPMIEAIRHHLTDADGRRVLQHVWLVSTVDLKDEEGEKVVQPGSKHLAPLFEQVIRQGFKYDVVFHYTAPELQVPAFDITPTYQTLEHIFEIAAPSVELQSTQVMADITGGRVPMSLGMALICAPNGWDMQYTTTIKDPLRTGPGGKPAPRKIEVQVKEILRNSLVQSLPHITD